MRFVALALVVSAGLAEAGSPLSKVIELLKELQATVTSEGEAELQSYNKYACWCRETTKRKIDQVTQGKKDFESLTTDILQATMAVKHSTAMVDESTKRLEANQQMVEEKSAKRQEEMEAYMTNRGELVEAIGALHKAIGVLANPTEAKTEFVDISKALRSAVGQAHQLSMEEEKASVLRNFIQSPEEFYQTGSKYAPQSGTITGILKDMYRQFAIQLQTESTDEMTAQKTHEELMASLSRQAADLTATKVHHEKTRAEENQKLSDATTQREETHATVKAAQVFFKQTVDSCHAKASEWNVRRSQRNQELDALKKATEILDTDENENLFGDSLGNKAAGTAFLQLSSKESHISRSAYKVLAATARANHSVRIASVAAMLQVGGDFKGKGGHFQKVIESIEALIKKLDREAKDDKADLEECQNNRAQANREKSQADDAANRAQAKADREQMLADKAQKKIEEEQQNQADIKAARDEANKDYTQNMANLNQAIETDKQAIGVVRNAINVLAEFYKCGTQSGSLLQRGKPDSLRNEDSEALGAVFSDKFSNCAQGGTIINMMQQIVQDMVRDVKDARETIENDTAANTKMNANSDDADNNSATTESDQLEKKSAHMAENGAQNRERDEQNSNKQTAETALADMKSSCDFIENFFQERREHRANEKEGLQNAMHILSTGGSTR